MSALYADHEGDNISWLGDDLPGWEPWEPDEETGDENIGPCHYCQEPNPEMRENPEPFGGEPCCEVCFIMLIGGEPDDPPWRCGASA